MYVINDGNILYMVLYIYIFNDQQETFNTTKRYSKVLTKPGTNERRPPEWHHKRKIHGIVCILYLVRLQLWNITIAFL